MLCWVVPPIHRNSDATELVVSRGGLWAKQDKPDAGELETLRTADRM